MPPPIVTIYGQEASNFTLRCFFERETFVSGRVLVELAERFLATLLLPNCRPVRLDTRRPELRAKLNHGEFSERRWQAARKKVLNGEFGVLGIDAQHATSPEESISFAATVNPTVAGEILIEGKIYVYCSIPYLTRLAADPERVESLLSLGTVAWNGLKDGAVYAYGNVGIMSRRAPFRVDMTPEEFRAHLAPRSAPAKRVHAVPVADNSLELDENLEALFVAGKGIKGAFWANYLSGRHVRILGGEAQLRARLPGFRIEPLEADGLLVVATDSPLPEDTEEHRQRFLTLHRALQPAFLARSETPENKRALLGYFYRERDAVLS